LIVDLVIIGKLEVKIKKIGHETKDALWKETRVLNMANYAVINILNQAWSVRKALILSTT